MDDNLTDEQKDRLRSIIDEVLKEDALTLVDESMILRICIDALSKRDAELVEDIMVERFGESDNDTDSTDEN